MKIEVNQTQLSNELETLADFSDTPKPSVTRIVYSEADRQARAWFKQLCREADLEVREDAVGNTFRAIERNRSVVSRHRHRFAYRRAASRGPI
jgi:acetylornithine deacetylase/succinyl-diaminopimelate desuccinylase-like protein